MSRQSGKDGDDFSQMLDELAQAQKAQEAELSELTGGDARPSAPNIDKERIADEVLASVDPAASSQPHDTYDDGEETKDEDGFAAVATAEADELMRDHDAAGDAAVEAEVESPESDEASYEEPNELDALAGLADADEPAREADQDDMLAALAAQTEDAAGDTVEPAASEESQDDAIAAMQASLQASGGAPSARDNAAARGSSRSAVTASRTSRTAKPPRKKDASVKAIFAPVLITMGLITLAPAIWAVLILVGMDTWMSKAEGVDTMAKVMLACWPVSLGLLTGGVISMMQVSNEKEKQRKRDEAMAARQRG